MRACIARAKVGAVAKTIRKNIRHMSLNSANDSYIDFSQTNNLFDKQSCLILPEVISAQEAINLVNEVEVSLRRRRYQSAHWDSVIEMYKEVEKAHWQDEANAKVVQRVRDIIEEKLSLSSPRHKGWLPIHVIDLAQVDERKPHVCKQEGYIKAHVDSIKFSGDIVSGLSLLSSAIMRLKSEKDPDSIVELLLEPRSLYVLHGQARYEYAHEILPQKESTWRKGGEKKVVRERRLSLIFRDVKNQ